MKLVFKDPKLRHEIFRLFWPFLVQELVIVLTTLLSNIILSAWGCYTTVMTGITNAFQIFFLYNTIAGGIGFIANLFMSQHYGRGSLDEVQKDYYLLLKIAFGLAFIFFILSVTMPEYLLFFVKDPESKRYGAEYLRWFSPVFLLVAPSLINYTLMKNVRLEKYSSTFSIMTFILVLVIESSFIFGINIAELALELAASSMIIARVIEFGACFFVINKKSVVKFKIKDFIKGDYERFKTVVHYGLPMVIGKISWGIGFMMITIITNNFVNVPNATGLLEAHSCMLTYQSIVTCVSNSLGAVVAVLIGRELGANRIQKAKDHSLDISRFLLVMGVIDMAIFILLLPVAVFATPSLSSEARNFIWKVFLIQLLPIIPRFYNSSYVNGLFNAGGDTKYIMITDGITAWISIVPLGYIGLYFNWDPLLIYALLQLEEIIKFPINIIRYHQGKWAFNITKKRGIVFEK